MVGNIEEAKEKAQKLARQELSASPGVLEKPMADKIQLEIVTPRGRALSAMVDEVTAPSVAGEFGVLPGHLPLLAALRTGIVTYRQGAETKRCAVGGGFAEAAFPIDPASRRTARMPNRENQRQVTSDR